MRCPVCEYPNAKPHYRMTDRFFEVSSEEFLLYRCGSCGLLFQDEEEIGDRLAGFYPPGYWWQGGGGRSHRWKERIENGWFGTIS